MALSKIRSESVDLADDFAFTGTVSGAGGLTLLNTYTVSSASVTEIIWDNTYFNSTYDTYCLKGSWGFDTDSIKTYGQFYQSDGTTLISGSGDYTRDGSAVYANTGSAQDHLFLCQNLGSNYASNPLESGANGIYWIYSRVLNSGDIKPDMIGYALHGDTSGSASTRFYGGRLQKVAGTAPTSAFQVGGLKIYPHSSANFLQNSTFSLYGLAK